MWTLRASLILFAPLAFGAVEITRPLMELTKDGELISRHTSEVEAMERASEEEGEYQLIRPTARIVVVYPACKDCSPDPNEPPADPILPFGDVAALQDLGLLPKYNHARTVVADTDIDWGHTSGERSEIGLLPEDHAAFVAGQNELLDAILDTAKTAPTYVSNEHKPNLFWLPYLMTGDAQYVHNMEAVWSLHQEWHQRTPSEGFDYKDFGRELAWSLRDLAQLAYLEKLGATEGKFYIQAFEATKARYLSTIQRTDYYDTWRILEFSRISGHARFGWNGWMESMIGQAIGHVLSLGFDDWKPIAEWHFEHLNRRSGAEWAFKAVDNDHVYFNQFCSFTDWDGAESCAQTLNWSNVDPYHSGLMPNYDGLPNDKLIPLDAGLTYRNRAQYAYGWAAMMADHGIQGAAEKRDELYTAIKARGDVWDNKNSYIGGEEIIPPPIGWTGWDNLPANQFVKVPNSHGANAIAGMINVPYRGTVLGSFTGWVGSAVDQENGIVYYPWGGGHSNSSLNGIWKLDLESMTWSVEQQPSHPKEPGFEWSQSYWDSYNYTVYDWNQQTPDMLPNGKPTSRHSYGGVWFDAKRNTVNQSRITRWTYSVTEKTTTPSNWPKRHDIYGALFYDEVKDAVYGAYMARDEYQYRQFLKWSPETNEFKDIYSPLSAPEACYTKHGRTIYGFNPGKWAEFNLDAETWKSGTSTGDPNYDWTQEMSACLYIPEWGKVLRQFAQGSLQGKWYTFDPVTKSHEGITIPGAPFTTRPGNKVFYYTKRNAVVYAAGEYVYVMRVQ